MPTYAIKGIPLPTEKDPKHPIPIRQEIDAWFLNSNNVLQVSLFIQALGIFQKTEITDLVSYYRVAGLLRQIISS